MVLPSWEKKLYKQVYIHILIIVLKLNFYMYSRLLLIT